MNFWIVLKIIAALATIGTGFLAFLKPAATYGFIGLNPTGVRGISEIRAVLGGLFIGLGAAPFFLGLVAYQMLGIGYLAIAAARAFSMLFDKSYAQSNIISLVIEVIFGLILVV
jgi:hypothetical protein